MILTSISQLATPPQRIISLVPSQTDLLHYLGLEKETVGITKFCVHPAEWFRNKIRVGGTKTIDIQKIRSLHPDLVIGNKEENIKEQIEMIGEEFPVWVTDINTLPEALTMISDMGILTGKAAEGNELVKKIEQQFEALQFPRLIPAAYLIWQQPYMTIGGDTFISDMMSRAGFNNVFHRQQRYPEVSLEDIRSSGCEILLLSSEPYPFKEKQLQALQSQLPEIKVMLADGEMFSWYGSRLLPAAGYFQKLRSDL